MTAVAQLLMTGGAVRPRLRAAGGLVLVFVGARLMTDAVADAYVDGLHEGGELQIQLCKEAGHYDNEPGRAPASEPRDVAGDAPGEG